MKTTINKTFRLAITTAAFLLNFTAPAIAVDSAELAKAEAGDAEAQLHIARQYDWGVGAKQDYKLAYKWYEKAAAQGNSTAQFSIGKMYFDGIGVEKNIDSALQWYKKAADNSSVEAQTALGFYYLDQGNSIDKAIDNLTRSANNGSIQAAAKLAQIYEDGQLVAKDIEKSFYWYETAAKLEHHPSTIKVAMMLYGGIGAKKDLAMAHKWILKAIQHKSPEVEHTLAKMYETGEFVKADNQKAYFWYVVAGDHGYKGAKHKADELKSKLTKKQLAEVKEQLEDYATEHEC